MLEIKSLNAAGLPKDFDGEEIGYAPIVTVEEQDKRITVSYVFPGFFHSKKSFDVDGDLQEYDHIDIPQAGVLAINGKPMLPSFGRYVQIPFDTNYKIKVKKGKEVTFEDITPLPAQEHITDDPDEKIEFAMDKNLYEKAEEFDGDALEVTGPFEIDGYNTLLIHIKPFRYLPSQKKLIGCGNITVTIDLEEKKSKQFDADIMIDPSLSTEAYGNLMVNPGRNIASRLTIEPIKWPPFEIFRGSELLIIYHPTHKAAAEKLARWKITKGITTSTVSIDTIGNTVNKIKTYIRNKRRPIFSRLRYVLLFGDTNMITSENITGSPWGDNITDYYYSTSKDPSSSTDYLTPWLSIGRIPTRTAAEGNTIVNQIIKYEKNPPADSDYYDRMAFAAYFQDDYPQDGQADRSYMQTMESIRSHMVALGFDVERIYVSNNPNPEKYIDGTNIPTAVKNAITDGATATNMLINSNNEGQLLVGHRDHGNWDGWSHPSFKINDLSSITSTAPSIFHSINCLTGKFDLSGSTDSFAEAILEKNGAAPSLIAATRVSHTWLNNDLIKALFDGLWPGVIPTFPGTTVSYPIKRNRLGDLLNYGKSYLPVKMSGSAAYIKDHYEIYHIFGDPTLELWTTEPLHISLRTFIRKNNLYIILGTCPANTTVSIWAGSKLLKKLNPRSKYIILPVKDFKLMKWPVPGLKRVLTINVSAPGYRFRSRRVYL